MKQISLLDLYISLASLANVSLPLKDGATLCLADQATCLILGGFLGDGIPGQEKDGSAMPHVTAGARAGVLSLRCLPQFSLRHQTRRHIMNKSSPSGW